VIGVAGSVSAGKSTTARLLRLLLARWPQHPRVELVTTDGFLHPNAVLERRGLMQRKGFPESYDRRKLLRFVMDVKAGRAEVTAPVYSHLVYDIVPEERLVVRRPDILLIEGLNVLQPATANSALTVSDFIDFSVYVDAAPADLRRWYVERFLRLRETAFRDPASYFRRYAELNHADAVAHAENIWATINGPNLEENILPTRGRASLVLTKGPRHDVTKIRLRKV
jgi:type I pantothenate kinase